MCVGGGDTEVKCKAAFGWCVTSASEIRIFVGGSNINQRCCWVSSILHVLGSPMNYSTLVQMVLAVEQVMLRVRLLLAKQMDGCPTLAGIVLLGLQ